MSWSALRCCRPGAAAAPATRWGPCCSALLQQTSCNKLQHSARSPVNPGTSLQRAGAAAALSRPALTAIRRTGELSPAALGAGGLAFISLMTVRHGAVAAVTAGGQQQRARGGGAQGVVQEVLVVRGPGLHHQRRLQCAPLTYALVTGWHPAMATAGALSAASCRSAYPAHQSPVLLLTCSGTLPAASAVSTLGAS
jgi:hypothetical protein